jgi:hypothetical protein
MSLYLNIPGSGGGGGVSSFTGDGTILSNSASTGAVTATLANAPPYTVLGDFTGSAAPPTYGYVPAGFQIITTTTTLTVNSPSVNIVNSNVTITLPLASTCIGKTFSFYGNTISATTYTVDAQGSDQIYYATSGHSGSVTSFNLAAYFSTIATASGTWQYLQVPGLSVQQATTSGAIPYLSATDSLNTNIFTGTAGQLVQMNGTSAPSATSTPGSGTALTSITAVHQIAGGTAPTVAAGAGAGTGGSPAATITGHDTDFAVTLTTGTAAATGVIFTATFGTAYGSAPYIHVTPGNANAAGLMTAVLAPYATSTTTTMVLNSGTTGITAAGAQYIWYVHCGQ